MPLFGRKSKQQLRNKGVEAARVDEMHRVAHEIAEEQKSRNIKQRYNKHDDIRKLQAEIAILNKNIKNFNDSHEERLANVNNKNKINKGAPRGGPPRLSQTQGSRKLQLEKDKSSRDERAANRDRKKAQLTRLEAAKGARSVQNIQRNWIDQQMY